MKKRVQCLLTFIVVLALVFTFLPFYATTAYADGKCTVTFDSQGGTPVDPIVVDYNTIIPYEPQTSREGYHFMGWFCEPECSHWFFPLIDKVTGDMTLYAGWSLIQHTSDGFFYVSDIQGKWLTIIGYDGSASDIAIPAYINGLRVTSIVLGALSHEPGGGLAAGSKITSVTFPHLTPEQLNDPSHPEWGTLGIGIVGWVFEKDEELTSVDLSNSGYIKVKDFGGEFDRCDNLGPDHMRQ